MRPQRATVLGGSIEPSARLLAGWLASRLDLDVTVKGTDDEPINGVEIGFADGRTTSARLEGSSLVLRREGQFERAGIGEEIRRGEVVPHGSCSCPKCRTVSMKTAHVRMTRGTPEKNAHCCS